MYLSLRNSCLTTFDDGSVILFAVNSPYLLLGIQVTRDRKLRVDLDVYLVV